MYSHAEERFNVTSHAIGLLLSAIGLVFLVWHAIANGTSWHIFSFSVFGASLIILYAASTLYHSTDDPERRQQRRVIDHASIYILIAGTYTPYAMITLDGPLGNFMFALTWSMAICGVGLKLFFTGKFKLLSTLMYLAMGWMMVFVLQPLIENLPEKGIWWLAAGGISYTLGAVLYGFKSVPFSHAIFHVFVLLGSFCHFISIYFYVLPA